MIDFPALPVSDWVTVGLTTTFVSAAALGLGILGCRWVVSMIKVGVHVDKPAAKSSVGFGCASPSKKCVYH